MGYKLESVAINGANGFDAEVLRQTWARMAMVVREKKRTNLYGHDTFITANIEYAPFLEQVTRKDSQAWVSRGSVRALVVITG